MLSLISQVNPTVVSSLALSYLSIAAANTLCIVEARPTQTSKIQTLKVQTHTEVPSRILVLAFLLLHANCDSLTLYKHSGFSNSNNPTKQNYRIFWAGRDLKDHPVPTPLP